ncbi:TBC1 domain family member 2A-like isoform X2 [Sycon ciliatum]|uniref:TBC1 domain family member 2A-like isoform X2 n=1 Tax=Sycon ciliatum TaxID=27933 RepID=UPI0031F6510F
MAAEQSQNFLNSWEVVDVGSDSCIDKNKSSSASPGKNNNDETQAKKPSVPGSPKSLCGYLSKQGGRGIIKPWRTRWFVFDDSRCMLFYYRNPQDFVPLGNIDIRVASLSFDLENVDKGQFEIKVEDKVFYLQAESRQSMMFWLNQLQAKRKASSRLRNLLDSGSSKDEYSGLANVPHSSQVNQTLEERLLQQSPPSNQAEAASAAPSRTVDWSLTSLKHDFRSGSKRRTSGIPTRSSQQPSDSRKATYRKGADNSVEVALQYTETGEEVPMADAVMATPETPFTSDDMPRGQQVAGAPVTSTSAAEAKHTSKAAPPPRPASPRPAPTSPAAAAAAAAGTTSASPAGTTPAAGVKTGAAQQDSSQSTAFRRGLSKTKLGTLFGGNRRGRQQSDDAEKAQSLQAAEHSAPPRTPNSPRQQQQQQQHVGPSDSSSCQRCLSHEQRIATLVEEVDILETEVGARQRLIQDFHQQITATKAMLRSSEQFVASPTEEARVKLLCEKDVEIGKLQGELVQRKDEIERTDVLLIKLRGEIDNLTDQSKLYQETLAAKDEVVVSLSNEVFQMKRFGPGPSPAHSSSMPSSSSNTGVTEQSMDSPMAAVSPSLARPPHADPAIIGELKGTVEQLKDTVDAYQLQNDFLNTEIVELNDLRQEDLKLISMQSSKMVEMEAAYLKLHSNHLIILQQMQKPQMGGMQYNEDATNTQEMVTRLLEDAMETDVTTGLDAPVSTKIVDEKYDRYGFERSEKQSVSAKATTLLRRGNELEMLESGHRARWELYMKSRTAGRRFEFTSDVKSLTRQGIPAEFRTEVWRDLIYARVQGMMQSKGQGYYQSLHQMSDGKGSLVYKQIELDLLRTLPGNKYYNRPDAAGVARLRRLLRAFAWHNPIIGYCQGLNRLAAIALLVLNEEDAFWCLVLIVDFLMPKTYYSKTLMASQVDQRVLKDLLAMKCPRLATHLDAHGIDIGLITFNWFLTIFVDNVPLK